MRLSPALNKAAHSLSTLRQRKFGMVWTSIMFASMGSQMETLVVAWLVWAIYASAFGSIDSGGLAGAFSPALAANVSAGGGIILTGILALVAPKLRRA